MYFLNRLARAIAWGIFLILLQTKATFSAEIAPFVPVGEQRQQINSQFEYIEDVDGKFTIDQVLNGQAGLFKPLLKKNLGFGYKPILWIRFSINFKDYKAPDWFLTQNYEHVGDLTLFYPTSAGYRSLHMTESEPADKRAFHIHNYLFKVPNPQTSTAVYYMRYDPHGHVLTVDLSWAGTKGIIEFIHNSQLGVGLVFGGLLAMWFYNFMLFVSLRSREYMYYLYYLACFMAAFIYINGFAPLLLESPKIYEPIFAALTYCAAHGMTLFARQFLSLHSSIRWLGNYLKVFQWILFSGALAALVLPVGMPYPIINILILFIGPFLMLAGIIRWRQGYTPARFYTAGWAIFIAFLMVYSLRLWGVLPANFVTDYALQIGSVWEAIMFSLALAYRIKLNDKKAALAKTAFLGMVSHELKTPLQGIGSAIDLLSLRKNCDAEILNRLRTSTEQLEIQVKDLTDYAHLESGKLKFRKSEFNPSHAIRQIAEELRPAVEQKGLEFKINIGQSHIIVSSDLFRIQQILNNLVSNAIKYTQSGHIEVRMSMNTAPTALVLSVVDTGIGISAEDMPSLFEPFTQLGEVSTRKHDGIGMGLAIVQKLVGLFDGTIQVDSSVEKGSTFHVTLPVEKVAEAIDISTCCEDNDYTPDTCVMLVDDNKEVRSTLKKVLEELGYSCDAADSGKTAINLCKSKKYSAILLDVNMPDIDGFAVASHIKNTPGRNQHVPIIWISATAPENISSDRKKLFSYFLEKPVRLQKLDAMLKTILA